MNILSELVRVKVIYQDRPDLDKLAEVVFTAYTQNGLPPDFAFDELRKRQTLSKDEKLYWKQRLINDFGVLTRKRPLVK